MEQFTNDQNSQSQQPMPLKPDNHLVMAILSTICCCIPLGIVAIIKATKVNSLYRSQQFDAAQAAADDAKKWSFIAIACGLAVNIIYGLLSYAGFIPGVAQ